MFTRFVGREDELRRIERHLDQVRDRRRGVLLTLRGRRQVGKSTLLDVFLGRSDVPGCFFAAAQGADPAQQLARFTRTVAASSLEAAPSFESVAFDGWEAAFRALAERTQHPSVVVLDELPYLIEGDASFEGTLQASWDRHLSDTPILLVAVGSDLSMMELISSHDRPLFGRAREMVLEPLTVWETAKLLDLSAGAAFDAQLITGGFPRVAEEWPKRGSVSRFLRDQLQDSTSPLVVVGERIVNAEFPHPLQARDVLFATGAGARSFTSIRDRAGLNEGSLARTLNILTADKRVLAVERPLSAKRSRLTRYIVADHYLRFWLRFIAPAMELILRGQGDVVAERIIAAWPTYRGRAIEPLVRTSIERGLPDDRFGKASFVGSYWTRTGDVEVDIVGAENAIAPAPVSFMGSIKWRDRARFGRTELLALGEARGRVPGAEDARLVGASRSGFTTNELDVALTPDELIDAWAPASGP